MPRAITWCCNLCFSVHPNREAMFTHLRETHNIEPSKPAKPRKAARV